MIQTSTTDLRQSAALVLVSGLLLVIGAPIWHQGDHPSPSAVDHDHVEGTDLHVCSTGSHASGPFDQCPVCLSQRLLTQISTQHAAELFVPDGDSELESREATDAAIAVQHTTRARGPPLH